MNPVGMGESLNGMNPADMEEGLNDVNPDDVGERFLEMELYELMLNCGRLVSIFQTKSDTFDLCGEGSIIKSH
ncbi:hypothetical protein SNE40_017581 [Patella caerulea]|uniref:Uncharacterized protein n=1 Tax=Patella caerulea TaxID=87958 RepID=A0AAN8PQ60_PATCE